MDSDDEENIDALFDSDTEQIDCKPFPDECEDEIIGIDCLYKCFEQRYNACPAFFSGPLRNACQDAFSSNVINERRPVLVYIHNDKSMFNNIFCYSTFCSTTITDYLLENYIVWPWDVTSEWNRNALRKIWNEIFSTELFDDFCVDHCPMLIGIMRLFVEETNGASVSEYQFKLLLKGDTLTRTGDKSKRETVLNELAIFKEECDSNEQALSCDFITKTGLCWEIILEITKYLSLNDTITAFSNNILPVLHKYKSKVSISEPAELFIKKVLRKLDCEQIVSVQFTGLQLQVISELHFLSILNKVSTVTIFDLERPSKISNYQTYFPLLNCLSLWYDNEVDFNVLTGIFQYFTRPIKRFEIHCGGLMCIHYFADHFSPLIENTTIKYFLLDMAQCPSFSVRDCVRSYSRCFWMIFIEFTSTMKNIQYVRLIANKYNIRTMLNVDEWSILVNKCLLLKRITLQASDGILENDYWQRVFEIQRGLRNIRETIKFQITFM